MSSKLGNGKVRKDQTDHYGRIKNGGGGGGATVDDFVDSDTIVVSEDTETEKVKMDIASDVVAKIDNSLQTPLQTPTEIELVAVDTSKSQQRITIGDGLEITEDNELKATGGGGGGETFPNEFILELKGTGRAYDDPNNKVKLCFNEDYSKCILKGTTNNRVIINETGSTGVSGSLGVTFSWPSDLVLANDIFFACGLDEIMNIVFEGNTTTLGLPCYFRSEINFNDFMITSPHTGSGTVTSSTKYRLYLNASVVNL